VRLNSRMYWYLVDETNRNYAEGEFFIVGGLVFTEEQFEQVHQVVRKIRQKHGFAPGDQFKFNTNSRPAHVSADAHREAKRELISALPDIGVRMIVYVILHDIKGQDYDNAMNYALNALAHSYHRLLAAEKSTGVMLMDRDNHRFDHLEGLFQSGLAFGGGSHRSLNDRIRLFGMTNDNASHLSSAADVALGAFRYCVNTAGGTGRVEAAESIFPPLAKIVWAQMERGFPRAKGYGYQPHPKLVRHADYAEKYDALADALNGYARVAAGAGSS